MIIYNVTIKLEWAIHEQWLQWMQQEHMPELISTGCFHKFQLMRLMEVEEEEGPTYAAQYYAHSKALYNQYIEKFSAEKRQKAFQKWGGSFVAFRSVMEVVA